MAPMHDWKDDAEFIRYNQPQAPRWPQKHLWLAILGVLMMNAILIYALLTQLGFINQVQPQPIVENTVAYELQRDQLLKRDAVVFNEIQHIEPDQ